jgi:hypothetical protein
MDGFEGLSLALKVRRGRHDGHALVHGPFADPEVVLEPFLEVGRFGKLIWFYAGAGCVSLGFEGYERTTET